MTEPTDARAEQRAERRRDTEALAREMLTERQARDTAAFARAIVRPPDVSIGCPYGGYFWHRVVLRLIRIHRPDYNRLLAEERAKGEQP